MSGIAAAFGAFVCDGRADRTVLVGRDSRVSGPMYARAVIAGLQSVGCVVVELGVVPTPTLLLAVEGACAQGRLGITASHNPADWNALKLVSEEGIFLDAERSRAFLAYLRDVDPPRAGWDGLGGVREDPASWSRHLDRILELPHLDV